MIQPVKWPATWPFRFGVRG